MARDSTWDLYICLPLANVRVRGSVRGFSTAESKPQWAGFCTTAMYIVKAVTEWITALCHALALPVTS